MPGKHVLDRSTRAHEHQPNTQAPRSDERPADDGVGRMVATHGIHCNSEH